MSTRLDRLISLLETGSTLQIKSTVAKQLGEIAKRSFKGSALPVVSAVKNELDETELGLGAPNDHIPTTTTTTTTISSSSKGNHVAQSELGEGLESDAEWAEVMGLIGRILPHLRSKSYETRTAAALALEHVARSIPIWSPPTRLPDSIDPTTLPPPPSAPTPLNLPPLLMPSHPKLLASSGKEFAAPLVPTTKEEVEASRAEVLKRLGISAPGGMDFGFGDIVKEELDKDPSDKPSVPAIEPAVESTTVKSEPMEDADMKPSVPAAHSTSSESTPLQSPTSNNLASAKAPSKAALKKAEKERMEEEDKKRKAEEEEEFKGLSARQINALKRKRKAGGGPVASTQAAAPPASSKPKLSTGSTESASNPNSRSSPTPSSASSNPLSAPVIVAPKPAPSEGASNSTGGSVTTPAKPEWGSTLIVSRDSHNREVWPFSKVVEFLGVGLFSDAWEVRHGAALGLREIIKVQGKGMGKVVGYPPELNEQLNANQLLLLANSLLSLLALDRFGDYNSDQVVAPVRETASQTLASTMVHLGREGVEEVHKVLVGMVRQDWLGGTGKDSKGKGYAWEVRHAGLLGLKYEVAVRGDLLGSRPAESEKVKEENVDSVDIKKETEWSGENREIMLKGVVDAAVLGLGDPDDDVRSVSAACLLPVATYLVEHLPEELDRVLTVLWDALGEGGDELGSSTGVIMNLLSKLITFPQCISVMKAGPLTLLELIPRLYPFFRHTIAAVRLAVPNALHIFLTAPAVESTEWIDVRLFRFLFQNLIVEERSDIRESTLQTFKAAVQKIPLLPPIDDQAFIGPLSVAIQPHLPEWLTVLMSPPGVPLDPALFLKVDPPATGKFGKTAKGGDAQSLSYNVDKSVMAQDLSLFSVDDVIRGRLAAAEGLALLVAHDATAFEPHFAHLMANYMGSTSSHQMIFASVLIEEWTKLHDVDVLPDKTSPPTAEVSPIALPERNANAKAFVAHLIAILEGRVPSSYYEMLLVLGRIYTECQSLLNTFATDGKIPPDLIPSLPTSLVPTEPPVEVFTVETAGEIAKTTFDRLLAKITKKTSGSELSGLLRERQMRIISSIGFYMAMKEKHDRQVSAAVAGAVIALRTMPVKLNPVIRSIMNGIKFEENVNLQTRFSHSVASLIEYCSHPASTVKANPTDKIIKNLCTFVCQDMTQTPVFSNSKHIFDGILTLQQATKPSTGGRQAKDTPVETEEETQARITRRGANFALGKLANQFGPRLFKDVPKLWSCVSDPLLASFSTWNESADQSIIASDQVGQDVIDSLTALSVVVVQLNPELHPQVLGLLPTVMNALQSRFAVIRQAAAKCIAAVCDVSPASGMKDVIQLVLPYLGDPTVAKRQGATEAVSHLVRTLDTRALPYVLFMIVPILGRMSDPNDDVRLLATSIFASLVKMVPLEAGIPDPPGFPEELLAKRAGEREFLEQLLDGSKVSSYEIPVTIKAELRKYQKEGINWLAFLAKYQLHGILCDDMGLGKSLQSLCILASKHHERAERFKATGSPDAVHLPSLIVCPSTLTGHWYHEILKFTDNLRPLLYVGNYRERVVLQSQIKKKDVIIMSYEVVRNDIEELSQYNWNYCILDEGHIIKNAKTKLTKAVKLIKANHRLVLSGTPIQNNVLELWSLFDFLMPGFLGTEKSFNERYGKPISVNRDGKATAREREAAVLALEALHKQVLPFLLRRLKEDVLHDLPPKIIQDYYCDLSDVQKQLYDDFSQSTAGQTAGEVVKSNAGRESGKQGQAHVFQSLQYLRKLCNHPCLVAKESDYPSISGKVIKAGGTPGPNSIRDLANAPKLLALKQILHDCGIGTAETSPTDTEDLSLSSIPQHRVLIFCQLKLMLDVIETDLFQRHMPSLTYMRMDGSTDPSKRHGVVQTFNSDPSIDVLLLTTQVGGLGLNLTGADTVIFVEHDWNPMKDLQAMDRAHRLGQKKVVNVYRLITKGTLEDKIMGLQRFKLNIASSVVTQQNSGLESMNTDQVLDLFKISTGEEDAADAAAKKKAQQEQSGPVSQQNLLEGLEDLPDEDEYQGLGMDTFLGSL